MNNEDTDFNEPSEEETDGTPARARPQTVDRSATGCAPSTD